MLIPLVLTLGSAVSSTSFVVPFLLSVVPVLAALIAGTAIVARKSARHPVLLSLGAWWLGSTVGYLLYFATVLHFEFSDALALMAGTLTFGLVAPVGSRSLSLVLPLGSGEFGLAIPWLLIIISTIAALVARGRPNQEMERSE